MGPAAGGPLPYHLSQDMATATATAPTTTRAPGRRKKKAGNSHGFAGFLFTLPFMLLFLGLFIAPLIYALYLSLYRQQLIGGNEFVGLQNYVDGIKDPEFQKGLRRVALFLVIQVPIMLILALTFAMILDSGKVWLPKLYRVGIFVPYAVPTVIAALMWGFLYGRDFGPFADVAKAIGTSPPNFLGERTMLLAIANVSTWTYTGYNMIILYAALRAIPSELYEAAAVDGAGAVRTALYVKLPLLRPALLLCGIFSVIGSFQLFAEPQVFSAIAPQVVGKSYTPNLYVYNLAFADQRLNYAAALSFLLGVVVFVVSYLVMYASRRQEQS
jgi:multiple sugar transport system permease protein